MGRCSRISRRFCGQPRPAPRPGRPPRSNRGQPRRRGRGTASPRPGRPPRPARAAGPVRCPAGRSTASRADPAAPPGSRGPAAQEFPGGLGLAVAPVVDDQGHDRPLLARPDGAQAGHGHRHPSRDSGDRPARCRTRVWVGRPATPTSRRSRSSCLVGLGRPRRRPRRAGAHPTARGPRRFDGGGHPALDLPPATSAPRHRHRPAADRGSGPSCGAGQSWSGRCPVRPAASAAPRARPGRAAARASSTAAWTSAYIFSEPRVSNVAWPWTVSVHLQQPHAPATTAASGDDQASQAAVRWTHRRAGLLRPADVIRVCLAWLTEQAQGGALRGWDVESGPPCPASSPMVAPKRPLGQTGRGRPQREGAPERSLLIRKGGTVS